jgi:hypothetical protein
MEQIMLGYQTALGFFVWPLIFSAVIGYVYLKQQSFVAAAVAAMIIISAFGNYLMHMETWVIIMYILVSLAITGLVLIFLSKRRT